MVTFNQLLSAPLVSNQQYVDSTTLAAIWTTTCGDSLRAFYTDVESACGTAMHPSPGEVSDRSELPGSLVWAYNVSCLVSRVSLAAAITVTRPSERMLRWALTVL